MLCALACATSLTAPLPLDALSSRRFRGALSISPNSASSSAGLKEGEEGPGLWGFCGHTRKGDGGRQQTALWWFSQNVNHVQGTRKPTVFGLWDPAHI
jgi:hypothetical protein